MGAPNSLSIHFVYRCSSTLFFFELYVCESSWGSISIYFEFTRDDYTKLKELVINLLLEYLFWYRSYMNICLVIKVLFIDLYSQDYCLISDHWVLKFIKASFHFFLLVKAYITISIVFSFREVTYYSSSSDFKSSFLKELLKFEVVESCSW